ncbi:DEKNAAC101412 [Brettanomyces naardenensis]|uniref:DEKNAAC101412 n=1 Tax=Brettanomyces naardenensis TaxID=13370 RepID=A0A448YHV0_BRENA|nr:DEKNAAC101412 [Brettanomyces naardenensis]
MDKSIKHGLNDRIYDKRKAAALELERVVKECINNNEDPEKIQLIIKQLRSDYAYAVHQPNARYGGLIGLAAVAIALGQNEVPKYLEGIMHPVLACFGDQDPMVRYFACEALYNIAKVSKGEILVYFNEIFDVLCKLVADPEMSVKNAADILDRLIKDIVSEKASTYVSVLAIPSEKPPAATLIDPRTGKTLQVYQPQLPKAFSLPKFIPLLKERMYATNPYTRMFLVSWLRLLDSIPDLEMISYLSSFLDPLLSYLSSSLEDVRVVTENFLKLLLHEIKGIYEIKNVIKEKETAAKKEDETKRDTAEEEKPSSSPLDDGLYIPGQDIVIDCPKIIDILINNLESTEEAIQLMVLQWLRTLLELSSESFIIFMPKLLSVLLTIISHNSYQLQTMAVELNSKLKELASTDEHEINYTLIVNQLTLQFLNERESTRLAALDWLIMLHDKDPHKFLEHSDNIFVMLLKALNDSSNKVIDKDLELLSKISNQSDDKYFQSFMVDLVDLFKKDRKLLDTRADFIIRTICKSLDSERVYKTISRVLSEEESNLSFVSIVIQILNNNLIIAPELQDLRRKLIEGESTELFENLFTCWSLNSPSLLSLTLLTSKYRLSWQIVSQMVNYDISLNILIQLDLLIQLLESPVFAKLRLDLLNPYENRYLFKCLYGLLMVLPQSSSFRVLQNRLAAISPIANLQLESKENKGKKVKEEDNQAGLLDIFNKSQKRLDEYRQSDQGKEADAAVIPQEPADMSIDFQLKQAKEEDGTLPLETSSALGTPKPNYITKLSRKLRKE